MSATTAQVPPCERLILCPFAGKVENCHHQNHEYTGDYDEAFEFWNGYGPPSSEAEVEWLDYFARYLEFLVPYSERLALFRLRALMKESES